MNREANRWFYGVVGAMALAAASIPATTRAESYAGRWEIQSLGTDRDLEIEQKGKKITVYRVMWPVFEGEKYKLEHMYRGRISDKVITGQLFVREEGLPDYESLRPFTGNIENDQRLILDGMPIARVN